MILKQNINDIKYNKIINENQNYKKPRNKNK